jgi:asparagine synthase (glutamine-hydrolysing)
MCGITGIYNFKNEALNSRSLRAMTNKIRHRGPDDEGYFLTDIRENINNFAFGDDTNEDLKTSLIDIKKCKSANLGFGFRRLSIQDLSSKGHQPMIDNESNAVIVFNGEIYNFIELRNELKEKGYHFNSLTDTEIILNAYLEWGEECVNHFNGMWAFAIWDIKEKKLFCSRDRFGIKPFYYYISSNKFSFASEIKALLEIVPASKNNNALSRYLYFDEIDTTHETFFENIYQLRPGYSLIIQNGRFENKPYYNILDHIKRIGNGKKITFFKISKCCKIKIKK